MKEKTSLLIIGLLTIPAIPSIAYATNLPAISQELAQQSDITVLGVWSPFYHSSHINDLTLVPNRNFMVDINITNAMSIIGYQMALVYDPIILQATRISFNNTVFGPNPSTYFQMNYGNLYFAAFSRTSFNGSGTLAHVELNVLALGSSGLDVGSDGLTPSTPRRILPACFSNITERTVMPDFTKSPGPGPQETSEYMMGDVAVGIILPQGPNLNWTDTDMTTTINGIKEGMSWWASQEPLARLRFFYDIHVKVPVSVEPIQLSEFVDSTWIHETMTLLNYTQGDAWSQVRAYEDDIRLEFKTDWAFTIFVVESTGTSFANGGYAHAYLGGPWVTMARFSGGAYNAGDYNVAVPAHEAGHIFYATDEYDGSKAWSGYLNAPDYDGSPGIMNRNNLNVSVSTRRQIGWVDCDENGVLDILDTTPSIRIDPFPSILNQTSYTLDGAAVDVPHPRTNSYSGRDISINKIVLVRYMVDGGKWTLATPSDGSFDNGLENFSIPLDHLDLGTHYLTLNVNNTVGNSAIAEYSFTVVPPSEVPVVIDGWTNMRNMNLGSPISLVLETRGVNARNTPVWVQTLYEIKNLRTGFATSRASQIASLQEWGETELIVSFSIPNLAGRYEFTATLYYTTTDPSQSSRAWSLAEVVHFRLLVTSGSG